MFANTRLALDGTDSITVGASVEAPTSANVSDAAVPAANIYPVSFNGADKVVIKPGGFALSDPIPLAATAGQWIYTRTNVSASAGQKWPIGLTASQAVPSNEGNAVGQDSRGAVVSNVHSGGGAGYSPVAIVGVPTGATAFLPTVGILGDSIDYGSGDGPNDLGWAVRLCVAEGLGYVQAAVPGDRANTFLTSPVTTRGRYALLAGCTHVLEGFGVNDSNAGRTTAQIQADRLRIWTDLHRRGIKVIGRTITPRTTSTDGWTTTAGQAVIATSGQDVVRRDFNAWLRDGAPIDATTKAVTSVGDATNVLRAGDDEHPLDAVWDAAAAVETSPTSGLWKPPERRLTDASWASGSAHLLSPSGAFTSADIGKSITAIGGGPADALYQATITSITSPTDAVVGGAGFGTAVASGGVVGIGTYTTDGIHPAATGHIAMRDADEYVFAV
ncbi:hypothetical protein QWY28_13155 [Nocardioides sp. SOB77]|uniref:SGNH hydrolase-type esterase domain-containing protein n=1 Tax=Nocardioides oceani TaxID=3058369 RepID=A0ABT8FGV1_9ACTN|nr:hypothetical protein [Nocardioides oceani]MDN4173902.1 hypothetical protein [Nocardioides oceani]